MGMGVDLQRLCGGVGRRGAVTPAARCTCPCTSGTETYPPPRARPALGLPRKAAGSWEWIFPANSLPSFYWPPELFEQIIAAQLDLLCQMGFLHLAAINGHAAAVQREILAPPVRPL